MSANVPSDVPYLAATNINVVASYHSDTNFVKSLVGMNGSRIAIGFALSDSNVVNEIANSPDISAIPTIALSSRQTLWLYYKDVGPLVWYPWWWWQKNGADGSMSVYEILITR